MACCEFYGLMETLRRNCGNRRFRPKLLPKFYLYDDVFFFFCFCVSRRRTLQRRVQEAQMSVEEQEEMLRNLERRETEFMRLQRRKVGIDDFEQLTVIGKGAFGEVYRKMLYAAT